jgi:two-component system nitrogen regulation response regulator NtrX
VIPFEVPPLRERREDIALLAGHFLGLFSREYGKRQKSLRHEAMELLLQYSWPGNVRELRNVIERMVIMVPQETIGRDDLATSLRLKTSTEPDAGAKAGSDTDGTLREAREEFEKAFVLRRLRECHWNITRAAERLGIERSNLHRKMKGYGIEAPRD